MMTQVTPVAMPGRGAKQTTRKRAKGGQSWR
jgi:hypothetical protein